MQIIERFWNGMPTIVENKIEEGCLFENTLISGFATIIIDEDFINEMYNISDDIKDDNNLLSILTKVYNKISEYFSSTKLNDNSRSETYANNFVVDENGMIIGTKISSLKGKNISQCSEKSLAAYVILEKFFSMKNIGVKPKLFLSYLATESSKPEPHAFVMLDIEKNNDSKTHMLFDVENLTLIENKFGEQQYCVGLYLLSEEQYNNLLNGFDCTPISVFENIGHHVISEKRIYGNIKQPKKEV